MRNAEVADLLERLAGLVEANGEDRFKVVAYRRAATTFRNMEADVEQIWREGRLEEIRYVGHGIAKEVDEYFRTGRLRLVDELAAKVPAGAPSLARVQGIGPRTAYRLSHDLGITSVGELEKALTGGKLNKEFGVSVREAMLVGIRRLGAFEKRMLLPEAEGVFQSLQAYFLALGIPVGMAGSLRRGKETVGDIDILSTDPRAIDAALRCPGVADVLERGTKRASVRLGRGVQVDVRLFSEEEYGAALVYFTGSKDHNIALRSIAIKKGWKLNEYGLYGRRGERIAGATEEEVYAKLGLDFVPPELREDKGEVERAAQGELPDLVRCDDIRGDLQMHSIWSDGTATLEAMAVGARQRGYEYMAVTDHSVSVRVANGLSEERFRRQWKEVDALNEKMAPFRILKGIELEIRADGTLDFGGDFLDEFDIVGASLHQSFRQDAATLTARVVRALEHPSVDFLCHPTNRLIGRREPNPLDAVEVISAAKAHGKMLEIDGEPDRLDMNDSWARMAIEKGVPVVIDSDAHTVGELDNAAYGVLVARRAWVEKKTVMNALPLDDLLGTIS